MTPGYFIFDGVNCGTYNAKAFATDTMNEAPKRQYTQYTVPGRSGVLLMDEGRYENTKRTYGIVFPGYAYSEIPKLRNQLLSRVGYFRLTDSFDTTHYFMASYREDYAMKLDWEQLAMGKGKITFSRKPQRYLLTGEQTTSITASSATITNPTRFPAAPLLRVYGSSGTVTIGSVTITLSSIDSYIDIDCEIGEAYKGSAANPRNDRISLSTNNFPRLAPGDNGISCSGSITKIDVTPRWWEL